ncbi:class I SAM-dependent methyltransferase [Pseudomonas sp. S2_C03]
MTAARTPFPEETFAALAAAEAGHWWFRARNRVLLWALASRVGHFDSFLEIGCGTGFVLEGISKAYPKADIYGSEYFEEGLLHARKRMPSATFSQLDATKMTDSERYDVIGAFDVIEHIEQDQLVINNLSNALKTGGSLLISVPQHRWLWSEVDEYACHVRRYTRSELTEKIQSSGLHVEYATSFVSFLVPLMWLSRLRARTSDYDPMAEFKIPAGLNYSLEKIMKLELGLLKLGIRIPVGGSLLIVARKE